MSSLGTFLWDTPDFIQMTRKDREDRAHTLLRRGDLWLWYSCLDAVFSHKSPGNDIKTSSSEGGSDQLRSWSAVWSMAMTWSIRIWLSGLQDFISITSFTLAFHKSLISIILRLYLWMKDYSINNLHNWAIKIIFYPFPLKYMSLCHLQLGQGIYVAGLSNGRSAYSR